MCYISRRLKINLVLSCQKAFAVTIFFFFFFFFFLSDIILGKISKGSELGDDISESTHNMPNNYFHVKLAFYRAFVCHMSQIRTISRYKIAVR